MDSSDLQRFITGNGIAAEILHLPEHTPTVETAAQALGVPVDEIGKSILFMADSAPVLVIANGQHRIDYKRVADHVGISRKRMRMANAEEVIAVAGYSVGAMPPFGHKTRLRTIIDARVLGLPELYAGGGDINAIVKVKPQEILRVAQAEQADVTTSA